MISALIAGLAALMALAFLYLAVFNGHEAYRYAKEKRGAEEAAKLLGRAADWDDAEYCHKLRNLYRRKALGNAANVAVWLLVYAAMVL